MSDNKGYTVLDGTNPTLDAADLYYNKEKYLCLKNQG